MKLRHIKTLTRAINNITAYLERNPKDAMQRARLGKLQLIVNSGNFARD